MTVKKADYIKPVLREHGTVEKMTQANFSGQRLDGNFSAGTPIDSGILS